MSQRNGGEWTEARFNGFIKSALRNASMRWPPKYTVKREARIERGWYRCAGYKKRWHKVPASLPPLPGKKRRINNALVDHIVPVVDPKTGFMGWDSMVERMFVEKDKLQLLCRDCHNKKTADEREQRNKK